MNFMSSELQEAFDKAKPVLENISQTKNQISNEIKYLEGALKDFSIGDTFIFRVQNPYHTTSFTSCDIGEYCLTGWAVTNEELLIWDKDRKRLMYQLNQFDADVQLDDPNPVTIDQDTCKQLIYKPLIETTFDVRKNIYEQGYLRDFFVELTSKYQVHIKEVEKPVDIPF